MTEHGSHGRRTVLRTLGAVATLPLAGCGRFRAEPAITVPETALVDERVSLELDGFPATERVTLRATARSGGFPTEWESVAHFETDDEGRVRVADQSPTGGTYEGADAMGPFWSMRPADLPPDEVPAPEAWFQPEDLDGYDVTLIAEVDGEPVAEATTTRLLGDPEIEGQVVECDELAGEFYAPPDGGPVPGILLLHGADGQLMRAAGRLLAARGFAALALRYFGDPDPVPDHLIEVPLSYGERAIEWLLDREEVAGTGVGVLGVSRGGELALLLGSRFSEIDAVVGKVPSSITWEGLGPDFSAAGTSAWSDGGELVPYLERADVDPGSPPIEGLPNHERGLAEASEEEIAAAAIPVEEVDAPVLLLSATDDRRWPSTTLSELAVERLDEHGFSYEYDHVAYEGAGHFLPLPYLPTVGTDATSLLAFGGNPEANARASADSWQRTLSLFEDALGE